ncbi:hypothetical protein KPL70_001057 [Citrus sinensis]|nr:hypothetical protein KPL70_001057 [Citrus sinensis]
MATNKERIERVEAEIRGLQDKMNQIELGLMDKLHHLEEVFSKLPDSISTSRGTASQRENVGSSRLGREESERNRQQLPSHVAKLEFPRYVGDDPTEWFNRVLQFFEYQKTMDDQKVALASFYFEECEDFDEALSHVKQTGTLRNYQKKFERLGNRVHGWTQKALVGAFMGGLKPEISKEIWMFRPRTLKKAIITWDEMQCLRVQGLCFNCNDKFTTGHKCTRAQLLIMNSEVEIDENTNEEPTGGVNQTNLDESKDLQITYYVLTGSAAPQTMHVLAKIGSYEIMVLINNRSTHNFISTRLANQLQLPIKPTTTFSVQVVNSEKLTCRGKLEKVQIVIQNIHFSLTVYSLPITVPVDMQQLLKDYEEIFQEPTKLPPSRGIDHCIPLKEGTEPVNVRPYRYAYFQKVEIEKQVKEMLRSELIRSSTSLFSSLVLLVEKKDGHIVTCNNMKMDERKVAAMVSWPKPQNITELRGFLGLKGYYRKFVKGCETCERVKATTLKPAGLLQLLPIPFQLWDDISIDFIEGLPSSQGKDAIIVVVDRLSKSTHFISLTHPFTAKTVAEKFIDGVVKLHGMTPFQALHGRLPPTVPNYQVGTSPMHEVDKALLSRDELLSQLKRNLAAAANWMKQSADKGRRDVEFKEGDMVGTVAYKLQLAEGAKIHHVFHVSLLKKVMGESTTATVELSPIDDKGVIMLQPESIVDTH